MATEVTLPQLGESVTEGTITAWLVDVGDTVEADQPLFELSSDKIDTEVPAPASGVLTEIKVAVDETVDVGTVVAVIGGEEGGAGEAAPAQAAEEQAPEQATAEAPAEPEPAQQQPTSAPEQPAAAAGSYERTESGVSSGNGQSAGEGSNALMSPLVRRLAAENDIDVSQLRGSGEGGRITREDVESAISGGSATKPVGARTPEADQPQPDARQQQTAETARTQPSRAPQPERSVPMQPGERERVEDLSRIRQRIAAKMMESMQSSAQLTTVQEADVSNVMNVRNRYKEEFKRREGVSLSPFAFLCRAALLSLRRHGTLNAIADWDAGKVKYHDYVNLGLAVDTDKGLLVPNVKRADDLTLPALVRGIAEAAGKARGNGKLQMQDIEGGSFTVTNTGSVGVLIDTPILNYPEVAILGTGAIKKRPVVVEDAAGDAIAIRHMMYLSLTYDHRLIDGADAARFVTDVKEVVETHDWEAELGY